MDRPQSTEPVLTAAELLARLSGHLDGLAEEVHKVEQVLTAPPPQDDSGTKSLPPGAIVQLQSLDRLRQSLEDLSLLTLFLARPDTEGRPALENPTQIRPRLRLGATRALLDTPPVAQPCATQSWPSGDFDLF